MSEPNQSSVQEKEQHLDDVQEVSEDWNTFDESIFTKALNDQLKILDKTADGVVKSITGDTKPKQLQQASTSTPSKLNSNPSQSNKAKYKLSHQSRKCKFEGVKQTMFTTAAGNLDVSTSHVEVLEQVKQKDKRSSEDTSNPKHPSIVPPIVDLSSLPHVETEDKALASMLMAWYMAGYHTGHYDAIKWKKTNQ